jgi:ADP-heptose:LPS heptosyltransferase
MKRADRKILVIQLARMGDLLQTGPLLQALRRRGPEDGICLLVDTQNLELAGRIEGVDEILPVDFHDLVDRGRGSGRDLLEKYKSLVDWITPLKKLGFHTVYNLNYSLFTSLIAFLTTPQEIRGFGLGSGGRPIPLDPWMAYLINAVSHRRLSRINLADIFLGLVLNGADRGEILDGKSYPRVRIKDSDRAWASHWLGAHRIEQGDFVIGLQPGAGIPVRRWPPKAFARLAELLTENAGAKVLLLGAPGEESLGQEIRKAMKHHLLGLVADGIGSTTIGQLAALLERCRLLVTNNTGTMHLGAAVGTKVVALFVGPAYCFETGPYGEGHLVVQAEPSCAPCTDEWAANGCPDWVCRNRITPELIYEAIHSWKKGHSPLKVSNPPDAVRLYISHLENGWMSYTPAIRREVDLREITALCYGQMWRSLVTNKGWNYWPDLRNGHPEACALSKQLEDHYSPLADEIRQCCLSLSEDFDQIACLMDKSGSIKGLEEALGRIRQRAPLTNPLIDYHLRMERDLGSAGSCSRDRQFQPGNGIAQGARFMRRMLMGLAGRREKEEIQAIMAGETGGALA